MSDRPSFETLVSVACHDLRTPLATVHGFARTLSRVDLQEPAVRYVAMIEQASGQIAELLDELALVTRISQGRYEPRLEEVDSLQLAQEAAAELEEGSVELSGEGAPVRVEPDSARRAVRQLARAARRHGGLDAIRVEVRGPVLEIGPLAGNRPAGRDRRRGPRARRRGGRVARRRARWLGPRRGRRSAGRAARRLGRANGREDALGVAGAERVGEARAAGQPLPAEHD